METVLFILGILFILSGFFLLIYKENYSKETKNKINNLYRTKNKKTKNKDRFEQWELEDKIREEKHKLEMKDFKEKHQERVDRYEDFS